MSAEESGMPPNSGLEPPDYCLECAHHLLMPDNNRNIIGLALWPRTRGRRVTLEQVILIPENATDLENEWTRVGLNQPLRLQ